LRIAGGEGVRPPQGACEKPPEEFVSVVDQDDGNHPRLPALLADASFWQFLQRLDDDLAAAARAARCPHCGKGAAPRGLPP